MQAWTRSRLDRLRLREAAFGQLPGTPTAAAVRGWLCLAAAAWLVAVAWWLLPTSVSGSDENPYPEVNPCATGTSELSGTIKVCTLIREEGVVRVFTEPRRAMVWIQISETGPTAHVSDTAQGVAYVGENLTQRDDWHVSIQTWNPPSGVRLESRLVYLGVTVGEARTFTFVCDSPPCTSPAPTSTTTPTSGPPPTRTATATATATADTTSAATTAATLAATSTSDPGSTGSPTEAVTLTATASPQPQASPTGTVTATSESTAAATANPTDVVATATPRLEATETPGPPDPTPSVVPDRSPTPEAPATAAATPTPPPGPPWPHRVTLPLVFAYRR